MKESVSTILGFLVAAIVSTALVIILSWGLSTSGNAEYFLSLFIVGLQVSVLAVIFVALPTFLIFRYLKLIRWWSAMAVGIAIGVILAIETEWPKGSDISKTLAYGVIGGISAFVFWIVWKQGDSESKKSG